MAVPPNKSQKTDAIPAGVPEFVVRHAPLVYLYSKEKYMPSDLATHLTHTVPKVNLDALPANTTLPSLTLDNLNVLNEFGKGGVDIYLTSVDDITTNPTWLYGITPDADGVVKDAKTGVIIVAEKGNGIIDAFYLYFYSYNWGGVVLGHELGDHVGDWEHTMVRFINEEPKFVYYSQHSAGQAFTWDAVAKDKSGLRPISFSANGSHADYALAGLHDHTIPGPFHKSTPGIINDDTDFGNPYDLTKSAYWYHWTAPVSPKSKVDSARSSPKHGTTEPPSKEDQLKAIPPGKSVPPAEVVQRDVDPSKTDPGLFVPYDPAYPVNYLYFKGQWGDQRYPKSDKRQQDFLGFYKYEGGPNGPAWKDINREHVYPGKIGIIFHDLHS